MLRRAGPLMFILCPFLSLGCAGFWDDITSTDFEFKSLYAKPNPLVVLRESTDGDKRAKALRALQEPSQHKGTPQDQELVVKVLSTAAVSEHTALARMAAIQSLSKFKDPRATQALIAAYGEAYGYRTTVGDRVTYPAETATLLRCQTLRALGEQRNPEAVKLLVTVLKQPKAAGPDFDRQLVMDERIAAARALGNFKLPQGELALLDVLKTEKDVALRDRAYESLESATGKKLPPDAKAWDELLHAQASPEAVAAKDQPEKFKLLNFIVPK
jgi:HEAT repeat protein